MTQDDRPDLDAEAWGLEPEDLDGHTLEELSDYLDAGRRPEDPSIEQSPGCQLALQAMERLRDITPALFAADTAAEPAVDERWVQRVLGSIALDARAGRRIPLASEDDALDLGLTEGAVRGLVRAAETAVPGLLIGRCRLEGDVLTPSAPLRVTVDVSTPYGTPIAEAAERLRGEIDRRLATHTELRVVGIDITVKDVAGPGADPAGEGR
ncbi:hypothetical protein N8K70_10885 [Microbacterium betulae]|uniref:Asp23/Gls24 family envelope stress response protein n=1 Tax=Microbacterium betulae TaxID=2981139 RepID=A0AA97FG77_9MICO|nr:hypothetical protein [Microbacterium sp. AB]WOF21889.1 hypothetical protein N8K70_10885 [Microbacterium sp. AB]